MKPAILATLLVFVLPTVAHAQTHPSSDPVIHQMWEEGMDRSQTYRLAQALLDSIGPRLTGSPQMEAGQEWLLQTYGSWGIEAEQEQYGTWMRWQRGRLHVDLTSPRVRSLEAVLLAWSGGTGGRTVRGEVVVLPAAASDAEFTSWLETVRGKFVAISSAESTCRPDDDWERWAQSESFNRMREERNERRRAWNERLARAGGSERAVAARLEAAGAAGVLSSRWSNGWGVQKIFNASTETIPTIDVSCEDYGLLFRMATSGQRPEIDVMAEGEFLGEGPVFNVIGSIPGSALPNEYVMLSAHFDSWDGSSGATDNGTGTITMLEAMRILKTVYPNPKRTILVGHWSGEEQGLNGSRGFAAAHPEIVEGLQALFNQDNGTGRVVNMSSQGLTGAAGLLGGWLAQIPQELTGEIQFRFPGSPSGGGSDHAAFICAGAPAFSLGALSWNYGTYTWHTNRDTFDKISFDDLRQNATLTAMLTYLAAESSDRMPRERREMTGTNRFTGQPVSWPECQPPRANWSERRP